MAGGIRYQEEIFEVVPFGYLILGCLLVGVFGFAIFALPVILLIGILSICGLIMTA